MILVDTSVWVEHLRLASARLAELLQEDQVLSHPFVVGELALSGLKHGNEVRRLMDALPRVSEASHQEVLGLVERWKLAGRGVGWIDAHLFASALLSGAKVWTHDVSLEKICRQAGVAFEG